jgi:hypothetical protein
VKRIWAMTNALILSAGLSGCGGGNSIGGSSTSSAISVAVSPSTTSVPTTQARTFTSKVSNDPSAAGVTWALFGSGCSGAGCGMLTNAKAISVSYTAPTTVPVPATVTLKATSASDPSKTANAIITVFAAGTITVTVLPASATVNTSHGTQFTANVANDPNHGGVTWSLNEPTTYCSIFQCGELSLTSTASGSPTTYRAPSLIVGAGPSLTITATSQTDPSVSASAAVKITCSVPTDCIP